MTIPDLLPSNPPALYEQLKCRTNQLLSRIVRANCNTQFARTASELTEFRDAMTGLVDEMDDSVLSDSFRGTVHLTTYSSYVPFIERLFERPCQANALIDLLAPGLPDYLALSSSTSGRLRKAVPRYNCMPGTRSSSSGPWRTSDPSWRRTRACVYSLETDQQVVVDEDNDSVKAIYVACGSTIALRKKACLHPNQDEEKMETFVLDQAAPFAAGFVTEWRSFLLVHALFSLASKLLRGMEFVSINSFVDMIRLLDLEYDMMVDCIANGTIPDLEGIDELRRYLQVNISPDPDRAKELRRLRRPCSRPGWCGRVWPELSSVVVISSGPFASSLPLARWFLGHVNVVSRGYGSAEARIGLPYSPLELNRFKPSSNTILEFLDITKPDSISSLAQPWEVKRGRRYELVLTTQDGLWRYRLGDVIEISGFDPKDGDPIIQFVERRSVESRFPGIMVSEKELEAVASSMLTNVVGWTTAIDDRRAPHTIGFFVELAGEQSEASELALTPQRALDELSRLNRVFKRLVSDGLSRKPTVRLVRPGTFREFLQLKLGKRNDSLGQTKVPVVLTKSEYVTWISGRILQEL